MSNSLKDYLSKLLETDVREDGRKALELREISIETSAIENANGSARVKVGETEVIVGVKIDAGVPFPDSPESGVLISNAELTPIASDDFEAGPPSETAIELARVTDRAIRESGVLPFDKLCIAPKEKVWMVFIDIYPINDAGNLFDAAVIGAVAALYNTVFPEYDKKEGKVLHKSRTKEKLPLSGKPVMCTFYKIGGKFVLDATKREASAADCRLSIGTIDGKTVCAMQKGGTGTIAPDEVLDLISVAFKKGEEIRKLIK